MQQKHSITAGALALGIITGIAHAQEAATSAPASQQAGPGGMMDRAADVRAPVYVDDSFASLEKIRTAARYERQDQSRLAIETYQQTMDEFGQKLIFLSDNRYVSLASYVRSRLLAMPAVMQGQYDHLYGPAAQNAVAEALEQNDENKLRAACDRYFPATAAVAGVDQAARISYERGAFATAARLWESLLDHPAAKDQKPLFLHHAAVALHLCGHSVRAHELRERLAKNFPDVRDTLGQQEQTLLVELDRQLSSPGLAVTAATQTEWPMFMGNPSRNAVSDARAQAGARLWSYRYRNAPVNQQDENSGYNEDGNAMAMRAAMMRSSNDDSPGYRGRPTFPVVSDGRVFIHSGNSITALSLTSSQELWEYPAETDRTPVSPAVAARTMAMMMAGTFNHDSCAVIGNVVYANLAGDGTVVNRRRIVNSNAQMGRIVALAVGTGEELWSTSTGSLLENAQVALVGAPLATSQGVYVLGRKIAPDAFSQLYLFRLNARTGDVDWSAYICSASVGNGYMPYGLSLPPAMMALADDILYISSGQSVVCSVDASLGRVMWLNIAEPSSMQDTSGIRATTESWRVNAPLIWNDRVVMAEPGSPIRMLERTTGKQIGSALATRDYGELVAGVAGDQLVTVGTRVCFFNLATGRDAAPPVTLPTDGGRIAGRPFMTREQLYLPMEKGLAIVSLHGEKNVVFSTWPMNGDDRPGEPGNLIVTDQQILVADHDEISWYSRWETARDYRLKVIQEKPADPAAHLDLAEIAFRTQHHDMAREYTAKAVELAILKQDGAGDVLARIYASCLLMAEQSARATPSRLDQARFYYEQCKAAARGPAANAQWRIRLAQLSLDQKRFEEAAALYSQILADPALRAASYQSQNQSTRAGVVAEATLRTLIESQGRQVYLRFEEQAAVALRQARQVSGATSLQNILDAFPNSQSALQAAGDLAEYHRQHNDAKSRLSTLHWLYAHTEEERRAEIIARISQTHADLRRWAGALSWAVRGERRFPEYRTMYNGASLSFRELAEKYRQLAPSQDRAHRPRFTLPSVDANVSTPIAKGLLLSPQDSSADLQAPDYLLFLELNSRASRLHIRSADSLGVDGRVCELPESGPAALIGVSQDLAILVSQQSILAVHLKSGVIEWKLQLRQVPAREVGVVEGRRAVRVAGLPQDEMIAVLAESVGHDPDLMYTSEMRRVSGNLPFASARILGDKLVVLGGSDGAVAGYNLKNGTRIWSYDGEYPGLPSNILIGNDQFIVIQGDTPDRSSTTFTILSADQGKLHGVVKMSGRAIWRALSDDDTFFAASNTGVMAYNLQGDMSAPLWRRDDIKMRQGTAAALTLDGVVVISKGDELYCLTSDGGESRWPDGFRRLRNGAGWAPGGGPAVRMITDGDLVLVQTASPAGMTAYRTDTGSLVWESALSNLDPQSIPSFRAMPVMGDPLIVQLAQGEISGRWTTGIYIMDRSAEGKLLRTVPLYRSVHDREGPRISRWNVTNAGVAFEVFGTIYLYGAGNTAALQDRPVDE